MIAAICDKHQVVWGIGRTPAEAMADAQKQAKNKIPAIRPGELHCVPIKKDAPLHLDGHGLMKYCEKFTPEQSMQMDLL